LLALTSRTRRARLILKSQDRTPFDFQAGAAAQCLKAIDERGRLLVEAPTGSGKTLISQLAVAMLAEELEDRLPRVLVVVPSRSLLVQHFEDAAWLGPSFGLAIHRVDPDAPMSLVQAMMRGFGVVHATPITLKNRLSALPNGLSMLASFDAVVFDEIDTYLTVDELEERRDTWPILQMCCEAELPILGFTGTHLTSKQENAWTQHGFTKIEAEVPEDWLPFTRVQFIAVEDGRVVLEDDRIRDEMRQAFHVLTDKFGFVTWGQITRLAQNGEASARRILRLSTERLRLFESPEYMGAKLAVIVSEADKDGPTLLLSRFRDTARLMEQKMPTVDSSVVRADGSMSRSDIGIAMNQFRAMPTGTKGALVITRELGGRGLDFPSAAQVVVASPRSNYQAVAQELARIRSRRSRPKTAVITYYADTEEQAKARRLGGHLALETYGTSALFEVTDVPPDTYKLDAFEGRTLVYQESLVAPW